MANKNRFDPKSIDQTIRTHLSRLNKPGVLTIRPGFEIAGEQLTGKQAIVATVHTKKSPGNLADSDKLPDKLGRYPVDVREASAHQRLRSVDPGAAALTQAYGRPEEKEPEWPYEREMPSGKPLDAASSNTQRSLVRSRTTQPATHRALQAHTQKPTVQYQPPHDAPPLERVELRNATITAHVSPDAAFATLTKFLAGTKSSLKIGMYDFTSGPILSEFLSDLSNKTLQLVLDNPSPNPTRDQTDWQTCQELESKLHPQPNIARALVRSDPFASHWMFPSAYHIKVIVRDGQDFWLSSGNLNNSNQPDLSRPPRTEDRDWHVIIQDKGLTATFLYYLNYDYTTAAKYQVPNPGDVEKAIEDAHAKKATQQNPPVAEPLPPLTSPVAAKTFTNINAAVTPLLTPDLLPNGQKQYMTNIVKLLKSAKKSIYIQLQYIESSKGDGSYYEELLQAIADQVAAGLDVKLIESADYGVKWAEKMKAEGVDLTGNIGLQHSVHNKGFVIDHETVVVSSQNFSPAGVHDNRDAGVIIESPEIAQYFEKVFLSDWQGRTHPAAVASGKGAKPAKHAAKKPAAAKKSAKTKSSPKQPLKFKAKKR